MAITGPFQENLEAYEAWFVRNRFVYKAEVAAVRRHLPATGTGLEIGVGTGLFSLPLGISYGVDPSPRMGALATGRGVRVVRGVGERLPFPDQTFDFSLMVTTICFLDEPASGIREARRVVRPGGRVIVGFVDRESPVGKVYLAHQAESVFYRQATFFSTGEVMRLMTSVGLGPLRSTQTVFALLGEIGEDEEVKEGHGEGSFVVLSGVA